MISMGNTPPSFRALQLNPLELICCASASGRGLGSIGDEPLCEVLRDDACHLLGRAAHCGGIRTASPPGVQQEDLPADGSPPRLHPETGLPVVVSFAFDSGKNKDRTMMGATPETIAEAMAEAGADAVGANCGVGVELALPICRRLRSACDLPLWIKPNAGLPTMDASGIHYATSAEFFASHFNALRDAGASFLGACCGSTPDFICALVAARGAS